MAGEILILNRRSRRNHGRRCDGRKKLLFVLLKSKNLRVLGRLLFGDSLADRAWIFAAERHADRLGQRSILRIIVDHLDPGHALKRIPLTATREMKAASTNKWVIRFIRRKAITRSGVRAMVSSALAQRPTPCQEQRGCFGAEERYRTAWR